MKAPFPGNFTSGFSNSSSDNNGRGGNVSLDYTHEFSDTHNLMASVSFNMWRMPNTTTYQRQYEYVDSLGHLLAVARNRHKGKQLGISG